MPLSEAKVRYAKAGEKPVKMFDGGGLFLLIQPAGGKLWDRYRFAGKQKTLALGLYPIVSLADARSGRDEARKMVAHGIDPSLRRKVARREAMTAAANTFRLLGEEFMAKQEREGRAAVTLNKNRWLLSLADEEIGDRPVSEITAPELLAVLRKVERRGRYETAKRLRTCCGMVFRYAIATARAERDPSADLRGALTAHKVNHRATIVDSKGIGALLRAIEGFEGQPSTRFALRLAPHVFARPAELRHAEWSEFDFDAAIWSIPAEKMKMRRPHRVPLSRQALDILRELRPITGYGRWLFPSVRTMLRPISENTLNAALRRLGYVSEDMSTHGFRAMAATRLNEWGRWNPDAIERQLAHEEANAVRRAYTHATEYWAERVEMMQAWSDSLDELRQGGTVVPLCNGRAAH